MPSERARKTTAEAHATSKGKAGQNRMFGITLAAGIVVLALVVLYSSGMFDGAGKQAQSTTILQTQNAVAQQAGSYQISADGLIPSLAGYPQQEQYTANYTGFEEVQISTDPTPILSNISIQFERYNGNARTRTTEQSSVGSVPGPVYYYYPGNGIAFACTANVTKNYTCYRLTTSYNASNFGLSAFIGALNSSNQKITAFNSSFEGMGCIALFAENGSSYNQSGVVLESNQLISGCVAPRYRIPLVFNVTLYRKVSGRYQNGSTISPASELINVELHLTSITNSSSANSVESLPANAAILNESLSSTSG